MTRSRSAVTLVAVLALLLAPVVRADVRSEEKTKFQLAGVLGRMVNFFGGKAAREGVTSTVAVKGDRMVTTSDQTGQIVDLAEEKIYDLDRRRKTYRVTTFADIRRQMEEARKKAQEEASKAPPEEKPSAPSESDPNAKELEVDFEVKNTGQKKAINGFDTEQAVMTITIREKGRTLEQSGGLVLTNDIWLTPAIPAMKEVVDFQVRYAQKLYGPMITGASPQDMAAVMALYPMMKPALEKMAAEAAKLQGTAILTVTTADAVKSAEQIAAEQKSNSPASSDSSTPSTVGGLIGGIGRRMAQRRNNDQGPQARANILTTTHEVVKVATSVTAEEMAVPAGFKESQ